MTGLDGGENPWHHHRLVGAELALIIGRMARRLSEEEAMDYVAGIAIGQDFAERDWETNESRWLYGKAYDAPIALGKPSNRMHVRTYCPVPPISLQPFPLQTCQRHVSALPR